MRGRAGKARRALAARAARAPQVMLKVTNTAGRGGKGKGGELGRSIASIRAHVEYLMKDRESEEEIRAEVETQDGKVLRTSEDIQEELSVWEVAGRGIPRTHMRRKDLAEGEKRAPKKATNLMLSMPAGTDPEAVRSAARAFVQETFEGYDYMMAFHRDRGHPHMHVVIRNESQDGKKRLHPNREQLLTWREDFAARLYERGVAAAASPRASRESHAYLHKAYIRAGGVVRETSRAKHRSSATPAMERIQAAHRERLTAITNVLSFSDDPSDRRLADALVDADPALAREIGLSRLRAAAVLQSRLSQAWHPAYGQSETRLRALPERNLDISRGGEEARGVLPTDAPAHLPRRRRQ